MQVKFITTLAYGTLVVDAYLALASVAVAVMSPVYHHRLPPFGFVGASETSRFLVLLVATWTALLAVGCLRASGQRQERPHIAGTLWFVLVLALVLLAIWLPLLFGLAAELWTGRLW